MPLTSIAASKEKIQLRFAGFPNYGSQPNASADLLERKYLGFETVPNKGEGELAVTHEISLAVEVGEQFNVRMNSNG